MSESLEVRISECTRDCLSHMDDKVQGIERGMPFLCVFDLQNSQLSDLHCTITYVVDQQYLRLKESVKCEVICNQFRKCFVQSERITLNL